MGYVPHMGKRRKHTKGRQKTERKRPFRIDRHRWRILK
jgi:hypothetical protein